MGDVYVLLLCCTVLCACTLRCVVAIISYRKPSILVRLGELRIEKFGDKMNEVDATQVGLSVSAGLYL